MSTLVQFAAEGPNGQFFPSDIKEFYFGGLAFLIVFGLLAWKLFPVISKALGERGERIRAELAAAEQAQAAADAEVAALKAKLGNAAEDGRKLIEEARVQAEKLKADAMAKADADAGAVRARAQADIAGMRSQVSADVQAEVSARALEAAEKVALANLDDATHNQLIEQYIQQVGAGQ